MNSFNVYGQSTETIGGSTPVWLGTVKPIPVGASVMVSKNAPLTAGLACSFDPETGVVSVIASGDGFNGSAIYGFIYNDVITDSEKPVYATCAIVRHHPEGLLIERAYPDITAEQIATLQAKIPGVLLVREPNQSAE